MTELETDAAAAASPAAKPKPAGKGAAKGTKAQNQAEELPRGFTAGMKMTTYGDLTWEYWREAHDPPVNDFNPCIYFYTYRYLGKVLGRYSAWVLEC